MSERFPADATDPATTEVIRKYLVSTANEMERTLIRTAYNAIVYEVKDFGISIYDRRLNLLADSPGVTLFLGANDYGIRKGVEYVGADALDPGDIVLLNYPYWSSRHPQDACVFAPLFYEGDVVAYPVVRAHWVDLGQRDAGYLLDATNVHQEGLLLPGVKIFKAGEPDEELLDVIRFNSRSPSKIIGDLNAQVAAVRTGQRRLRDLYEKYGEPTVEASIRAILAHGEEKAREATASLPNGQWTGVDYLDSDGINDELVRMEAEVTVTDDEFTIDLSGSADAVEGPFNVPIGLTQSFCKLCFKTVTTPDEPSNGGQYAPLSVVAPEGSLFHATYPTPTYAITTAVVAIEVVLKALAEEIPDRLPASTGGELGNVAMYGRDPASGETFVQASNTGVGWGASPGGDGSNALMHYSESTVRNVPIEIWEAQTPVRVNRLELRQDSGGAGEHRGGLGIRIDYEAIDDSLVAKSFNIKTRTEGWGVHGGRPGARGATVLYPDRSDGSWTDRFDVLVDNTDDYDGRDDGIWAGLFQASLGAGEVVSVRTGGGGGYGDPMERDPEAVAADVENGYVSRTAARETYGVAVTADHAVDAEETAALRGS